MSRLNYEPYDVSGASVSVLAPHEADYVEDAERYGVDDPTGRHIVGIGADYPDVVLVGSRDQLIAVARDMLAKLGA